MPETPSRSLSRKPDCASKPERNLGACGYGLPTGILDPLAPPDGRLREIQIDNLPVFGAAAWGAFFEIRELGFEIRLEYVWVGYAEKPIG